MVGCEVSVLVVQGVLAAWGEIFQMMSVVVPLPCKVSASMSPLCSKLSLEGNQSNMPRNTWTAHDKDISS